MNQYNWGPKTFYAYSEMQCSDSSSHMPHAGNWKHTIYGPYMCWGVPARKEPTDDDIRVLAGRAYEDIRWMREFLDDDSEEAKAFDKLDSWANFRDKQ